jgi:hypothetical protein
MGELNFILFYLPLYGSAAHDDIAPITFFERVSKFFFAVSIGIHESLKM